jgi:hypothetical protein
MKLGLLISSLIYLSIILGISFFWAFNYSEFTHSKGGELITFVKYLLLISYLVLLVIQFTVKRVNLVLVLIQPIATLLFAFVIGIMILLFSGLEGIPKHNILVFGFSYAAFTSLFIYLFWYKQIPNNSNA